jgi:hypothetical protein
MHVEISGSLVAGEPRVANAKPAIFSPLRMMNAKRRWFRPIERKLVVCEAAGSDFDRKRFAQIVEVQPRAD